MQAIFLGCSDGQGVPRVGCACEVCHHALAPDSRNRRTGPSMALRYGPSYAERLVLIDVAPEIRLQVTRLGLRQFDALLTMLFGIRAGLLAVIDALEIVLVANGKLKRRTSEVRHARECD